jgi:hypothetical protein
VVAYGAAQEEQKEDFLAELSTFCNGVLTPYIVGGDFNTLWHSGEKKYRFCANSLF